MHRFRTASTIPFIAVLVSTASTSCEFPRPANLATIGGDVHGLWDGADGVVLRLQAADIDAQLTVNANGPFRFPDDVLQGSSYSVTVVASPARHTCIADSGSNGTVTDTDVAKVSIACAGPDIAIALAGPWGWMFDPSQDTQTFAASIMLQEAVLTITGKTLTTVNVNHAAAVVGKQIDPIALPLGSITIPVEVNAIGGLSKTYQLVFDRGGSLLEQMVYGKASNPATNDAFGRAIALFNDTLVVGASGEDSSAIGVNGNQGDNSITDSGAVYVFVRSAATWGQQAYIKASNTGAGDRFGASVALSGDTLVVGAPGEASNASGINGDQSDNSIPEAGAVYVFVRNDSRWLQQAYIKPTNTRLGHKFGTSLALSGNSLVVSGNQVNDAEGVSGAVYFFTRDGLVWSPQGVLSTPLPPEEAHYAGVFLLDVTLSGDTLAVPAQEVNLTNGMMGRGGVYVFARNAGAWVQQAYLTASSEGIVDQFGASVSLYGDTLAVGTPLRLQGDTSGATASKVHIFTRTGTTWTKQGDVTGSNTTAADSFGTSVAISRDTLVVGARSEASTATGVNGDQGDGAAAAGAVYLFIREDNGWTQRAYIKASNTDTGDFFGGAVALSGDTLVVGAASEASAVGGVNPPNGQSDDSASHAGAIYIFR